MTERQNRIAILTFHNTTNYGASLQVFALQKYLKNIGENVFVLDYSNNRIMQNHKRISFFGQTINLKSIMLYFLIGAQKNKKNDAFEKFSEKMISLSEKRYNKFTIKDSNTEFDTIIVGSDQVWNYRITNNDSTYLLDFVDEDKVLSSYAGSFGVEELPEELIPTYSTLLKRINFLSVRETHGQKIIHDILGKSVPVVLDPIFLLEKSDWNKIALYSGPSNLKYILLYVFGRPKNLFKVARKISKVTGWRIYIIGFDYRREFGFHYLGNVGPQEFVGYLMNAAIVLTNSFHGTALSINLNKQFYMDFLPEITGVNSRLSYLVELFQLQNRIIHCDNSVDLNEKIDYSKINKIIEVERRNAFDFLDLIRT